MPLVQATVTSVQKTNRLRLFQGNTAQNEAPGVG